MNIIKKTHIFPLLIYSQNETFLLFSITAIAHSFSLHSHQNEIYTFCCVFTSSSRALYTQRIIELFLCFDTRAMHFGGPKHTKFEMHFSYNSSTIYFERMCTTFSNGMCAANRLRMSTWMRINTKSDFCYSPKKNEYIQECVFLSIRNFQLAQIERKLESRSRQDELLLYQKHIKNNKKRKQVWRR